MRESNPQVELRCTACQHEFFMSKSSYYNGGFIVRQCSSCKKVETRSSINLPDQKVAKSETKILLLSVDY